MKKRLLFATTIVALALSLLLFAGGCAVPPLGKVTERGGEADMAEKTPPATSLEASGAEATEARSRRSYSTSVAEIDGAVVPEGPDTLSRTVRGGGGSSAAAKTKRLEEGTIFEPAAPVKKGDGSEVVFNFDDADIYEVIKTVGDLLDISYIVGPEVRGKVTIHTAKGLSKADLFPIFNQILDINGLAAVKEGDFYKIIPLKDASRLPVVSRFGREGEIGAAGERIIIQLIPLQFISPDEMTKLLTPFVSANGVILSHPGSNTLVVVDKSLNINKILRLVDVFDVNIFDNVHYRIYPLKHMVPEDMGGILEDIFTAYGARENLPMKFIAISSLNLLMVVSSTPDVFPRIDSFIAELDVASEEVVHKIYVYYVKNGESSNLAEILQNVFSGEGGSVGGQSAGTSKKTTGSSYSRNPFGESSMRDRDEDERTSSLGSTRETGSTTSTTAKGTTSATLSKGEKSNGGTLKDDVTITADEIRNALIIDAVPSDYRVIAEILKKLDILPRQVLIEATIAEITLDKSDQLGVEWSFGSAVIGKPTSFAATLGASGLKYSLGVTEKWYAELNALASKNKVNVLSSPHVLASDNKEARMDVSREIPVASASYRYSSSTDPVTETSIQYRDTGVILTVTPHINERGLVTMEISQEVSDQSEDVQVAGQKYPSFFKRTVNTTLTVRDGQTLVIGGLIKDKESSSFGGVPCLINAPVLRYLTGTGSESLEKTELIILITPRVIVNDEDVDIVTTEFKDKVRHVTERFQH
ncbi:secretin N-terminal domain-containing protein [Desulfatiglans anilini]|uniref:secretin N-terminal domain-containing protein n=1 Tax=Desulfatiglans anilini TaxID=90728 RepID=UPI0004056C13|nr:secretin N-terminal domain-containing protein [Desulfatiglans anilini]